jgi:hypothetical protein
MTKIAAASRWGFVAAVVLPVVLLLADYEIGKYLRDQVYCVYTPAASEVLEGRVEVGAAYLEGSDACLPCTRREHARSHFVLPDKFTSTLVGPCGA